MKRTKPFILYLLVVTAFIFPCCMEKKEENVMLPVRGQLLFRTDTLIRKTASCMKSPLPLGKAWKKSNLFSWIPGSLTKNWNGRLNILRRSWRED